MISLRPIVAQILSSKNVLRECTLVRNKHAMHIIFFVQIDESGSVVVSKVSVKFRKLSDSMHL